jgi:F-type H+-transporting ATPase subunit delta
MFQSERWARAFANVCGDRTEEGFNALKAMVPAVAGIPGLASGSSAGAQLERMLRTAVKKAGFGVQDRGTEYALRFLVLLVRKDLFKYHQGILGEIEKITDRQRGILKVTAESALPLGASLQKQLKAELKQQTGAREVILTSRIAPELLGGYRLFIGTRVIDTSLKAQLRNMAADLHAGGIAGGGF